MVYMKKSPFLQKYLDLKSGLGYTIKISQGGFNVNGTLQSGKSMKWEEKYETSCIFYKRNHTGKGAGVI